MAEHVFILGAGASKAAGAPLMADFLDKAEGLLRSRVQLDREAFKKAFEGIHELTHAQSKAQLDTRNIESVFSAFEMAEIMGRIGRIKDVGSVQSALRTLVTQTLEASMRFPRDGQAVRPITPFVDLANALSSARRAEQDDVAILTFNYDIGLDHALSCAGLGPDYCLVEGAASSGIPLLKLHGSISWMRDSKTEQVYASPMRIPGNLFFPPGSDGFLWRISEQAREEAQRDAGFKAPETMIVPPTWSKGEHYKRMKSIWSAAAEHLSKAACIYVIGYSLPETDLFFRYLYALGTISTARLRRFWVFNPDGGAAAPFQALIGQAVQPPVFQYIKMLFEDVSGPIGTALEKPYADLAGCGIR